MTARAWSLNHPTCICGQPYALSYDAVTVPLADGEIEVPEVQWMICVDCGTRAFSASTLERIENLGWSFHDRGVIK